MNAITAVQMRDIRTLSRIIKTQPRVLRCCELLETAIAEDFAVDFLLNLRCEHSAQAFAIAAGRGDIRVMRTLRLRGCAYNQHAVRNALIYNPKNKTQVLDYMLKLGVQNCTDYYELLQLN